MKFLLPLILLFLGVGAGVGAGMMTAPPAPEVVINPCEDVEGAETHVAHLPPEETEEEIAAREFVKMNNQFVIPVVENEVVASLVVISLSLEVEAGQKETIYAREPKLRDAFLQVMFDHANLGGFGGSFTDAQILQRLRSSLQEVAGPIVGDVVKDILIQDIARQDV